MKPIEKLMRTATVIPVLVIDDIAKARLLAEAQVKDGYPVLEVTLRTQCALEAIKQMKQVDSAIVGAGTVTNPEELDAAIDAGAEFIVSPGLTEKLGKAAIAANIPIPLASRLLATSCAGLISALPTSSFSPPKHREE